MSRGDDVENNCFLVDWISFRCTSMDLGTMIDYLDLKQCAWTSSNGFYGYRFRSYMDGISIHYGNDEVEGVLVEMSGKGCRAFETFSEGMDWMTIFDDILHEKDFKVTRLDIAYDDHTGDIPIKKLFNDVGAERYVSKFKVTSITREDHPGHVGQTIYLGSAQSELRYRIYDKAFERGFTDGRHWVRFEKQLRRDYALRFLAMLEDTYYDIAACFSAVLNNYFRVVKPPKVYDSNKRRWETAPYWKRLIDDVIPASLWVRKDLDYNKAACESYVYHQAGNAAFALISVEGLDEFYKKLCRNKPAKYPERYKMMVETEKMLMQQSRSETEQAENNGNAILDVIGECGA